MINLKIIDDLITREGGYTNDLADPGGETNFGITAAVARANGYNGPISLMPRAFAQLLYYNKYWKDIGLNDVDQMFEPLAEKLFDISVNQGPEIAFLYLQRALKSLGYQVGALDGKWGTSIALCLSAFLKLRGDDGKKTLLFMIAAQQAASYINLALSNQTMDKFEYGWQHNRSLYEAII